MLWTMLLPCSIWKITARRHYAFSVQMDFSEVTTDHEGPCHRQPHLENVVSGALRLREIPVSHAKKITWQFLPSPTNPTADLTLPLGTQKNLKGVLSLQGFWGWVPSNQRQKKSQGTVLEADATTTNVPKSVSVITASDSCTEGRSTGNWGRGRWPLPAGELSWGRT